MPGRERPFQAALPEDNRKKVEGKKRRGCRGNGNEGGSNGDEGIGEEGRKGSSRPSRRLMRRAEEGTCGRGEQKERKKEVTGDARGTRGADEHRTTSGSRHGTRAVSMRRKDRGVRRQGSRATTPPSIRKPE